ncbi:unnamed protein product [Porites lobata]|uniref:Oligosaccharyltransferase complex subunit n=1 Tax=Porites lobata TaxID=104759 RepID=A0ABN8MSF3_9CNID|nr:unnamed protein product [Porites lobata]
MEALYAIPFHVLEVPNLKLKKPGWVKAPSAMVVFAFVLLSYFLVTGGKYVSFFIALPRRTDQSELSLLRIIYDVIVEPPSVGSTTDEFGHSKPVAFMPYRVNGQYIMEGLASSFLFSMGGLGFIILDKSNAVGMSKLNRFLLLFLGFVCVLVSFFTCRVFMRMKLP